MIITEVEITLVKPVQSLIAFARITVNNELSLSFIAIHQKLKGGYRLTYPTKVVSNRQIYTFNPLNRTASKQIEEAIFARLKEVMAGMDAGHNSSHT